MIVRSNWISLLAGAVAFFVCVTFALYTHHAWEDYLITFRASLNLAQGKGLVFQAGERVHSFTSPLGTLLPALFALGDGVDVEIRALWGLRITSALALGLAVFWVMRESINQHVARWAVVAGMGLWIFDAKIVDFSINGMESGLMIFFAVWTWNALVMGARQWPTAIGLAGLQWTRPDGFIVGLVLILAWRYGRRRSAASAVRSWLPVIVAGAWALLMYLPWVIFAWSYYGSPVPHTILAKHSSRPPLEVAIDLVSYPLRLLFGQVALHDIFCPAYFYFGGWPALSRWFAHIVGTGAALAWLLPWLKEPGRIASFALFLGGFYLQYIPGSPWYFPVWEVLACISWIYLFDAVARWGQQPDGRSQRLDSPTRMLALIAVGIQIGMLGSAAWQMKNQQALIEENHRKQIGLWLKAHAAPRDRVYLEPLGYIGFYSQLKMFDNPGLASPEVVQERRKSLRHADIIMALKPEWLVLRPDQVDTINEQNFAVLARDYSLVKLFDARDSINAVKFLPGRAYLDFDARFLVFRRNSNLPAVPVNP